MTQAFNLAQLANNLNTSGQLDATDGLTGALPIANGGTGQTSASSAINALLPTQTGNSGRYLTTNGSAASWGALTAKFVKQTIIYNSTTRTTGTNSTYFGTIGGVNVYYNNTAMMSGTFTKASATSNVFFHINWTIRGALNGHGLHGALLWKDAGVYVPFNENFNNTSGAENISRGYVATIGGLAAGSHTFYFAGTRADTTNAQWALNPNQEGASQSLNQGQSMMVVYEIEP